MSAPLPKKLPGRLFVVEYDRLRGVYILHIQDEDASSFVLGRDDIEAQRAFERMGYADLGFRALGMAREFGAAKASLKDGRVAALIRRDGRRQRVFPDETKERNSYVPLPALRSAV